MSFPCYHLAVCDLHEDAGKTRLLALVDKLLFLGIKLEKKKRSGAQDRTRTDTSFTTPAPEAGASTNFATWAHQK